MLWTLSDLGVNGHDVNLRDKCGVCDDTRPPGLVGRGWLGVRRWGRAVWTLWGGVSGHSVNLRDKCSVCDVVTVQQGWMRRSSGRSRS